MNFLLITDAIGKNFEPELIKELNRIGVETDVLDVSKAKNIPSKKYNLVYSRLMPSEIFGLTGYPLSKYFELSGCKFVDIPDKVLNFQNKWLCYELLRDIIPNPKTELILPKSKIDFEMPFIIKPVFGLQDRGVERISTFSPERIKFYFKRKSNDYLINPYIVQEEVNFDILIRVFLLDKKPLFALSARREGYWCHVYDNASLYKLDKKLEKFSRLASKTLDINIGALDFFKVGDDYIFNEFNYTVDLPNINEMLGYNLHEKVAKFFVRLAKSK